MKILNKFKVVLSFERKQKFALNASYAFFCLYFCMRPKKKRLLARKYVFGTNEVANFIKSLSELLPSSYTVCLTENFYYKSNVYDFTDKSGQKLPKKIKPYWGALLLGYLANVSDIFVFFWDTGFCTPREQDFSFLLNKQKKIICIFLGSDARSLKKTISYYTQKKEDHWSFYLSKIHPHMIGDAYEREKKIAAENAESYANLILTSENQDTSYFTKPHSKRLGYLLTADTILKGQRPPVHEFTGNRVIKVVHAASNPVIKGTALVQKAVKALKAEGYEFEYREEFKLDNQKMIQLLIESDILLYQFYAVAPGVMGVEGLISECAVLLSAEFESLGIEDDNSQFDIYPPWLITKYWQVYDNFKYLLDNPSQINFYKANARRFTELYCNVEFQKKRVETLLDI